MVTSEETEQGVWVSSVPPEMWPGQSHPSCFRWHQEHVVRDVLSAGAAHAELNTKMTGQPLPPGLGFVCTVNHSCIYTRSTSCLWPFLSNYANCLGLSLSHQSLKSLRGPRAERGRGGRVLAQLWAGLTPPAQRVPRPTVGHPTGTNRHPGQRRQPHGKAGHCPTAPVPTALLWGCREMNLLSNSNYLSLRWEFQGKEEQLGFAFLKKSLLHCLTQPPSCFRNTGLSSSLSCQKEPQTSARKVRGGRTKAWSMEISIRTPISLSSLGVSCSRRQYPQQRRWWQRWSNRQHKDRSHGVQQDPSQPDSHGQFPCTRHSTSLS